MSVSVKVGRFHGGNIEVTVEEPELIVKVGRFHGGNVEATVDEGEIDATILE